MEAEKDGAFELREPAIPSNLTLGKENAEIRSKNGHPWEVFNDISVGDSMPIGLCVEAGNTESSAQIFEFRGIYKACEHRVTADAIAQSI